MRGLGGMSSALCVLFLWLCVVLRFGGVGFAAESSSAKPSILFITSDHPTYRPSRDYMLRLHEEGYELNSVPPEKTTPELLAGYNVVVLFGVAIHEPEGKETPEIRRFVTAVADYAKKGGGVLFAPYGSPYPYSGYGVPQTLMAEALGGRILWEEISDPQTDTGNDVTGYHFPFSYTRELDPDHPVTKGLQGVWYPTGSFSKDIPTTPWEVGDDWTVLVKGGRQSSSQPLEVRVPYVDGKARKEGYSSYVPIVVARELGRGRVVLCGISPMFHLMDGHAAGLKRIVSDRGYDGRASDVDEIIFRSLKWLGEPSVASATLGGATTPEGFLDDPLMVKDTPLLDWSTRSFGPAPKQYRGVIGARTSRSRSGKGSVADYVRAAKKAGLDFIVFLETWTDLTDEEWRSLVDECKAAGEQGFIAYPGITLQDKYGGHRFAFGEDFQLPGPEFTAEVDHQKRFWWLCGDVGVGGMGYHTWRKLNKFTVRVGSWRHAENPWPYYSERAYDSMAVITSSGAKVTEDILDGYLHLQNRGEGLYPVAVTIVNSPDEMQEALRNGMYWNAMTEEAVKKNRTPYELYLLATDLRYLSNGPRIEDFRTMWHRDYAAIDWWRTDWYRWPLRIVVSSDAGLKEVLLMDGEDVYRRWLPGGAQTFVEELVLCNDYQHDFILVATDMAGRRAISSELITRNHMGNETMCADRMNQMGCSYQKREDGRRFEFAMIATPWKGNNSESFYGAYCMGGDPVNGGGVRGTDGAETGIADSTLETVIWSQARGNRVVGTQFHRTTDRVVGSPDIVRGWGLTDGRMVVDRPRNVWYDLVPVVPTDDYQEWVQRTFFTVWPDMLVVEMLERRLSVLKDIDLGEGTKFWRIAQFRATKRAPKFAVRSQGKLAYDGEINEYGLRPSSEIGGMLEPGDYVAYYNGAVSNVAYVVYEGNLRYSADLRNGRVSLYVPWDEGKTVIPAGTTVKYTLFSVVSPNLSGNWPADSLQFVELFRDRMGLDGDVPYRIIPTKGRVVSTNYIAVVEAEAGEFVAKTESLDLPASLPLEVRGLNPNWSAGFADLANNRYRPIAMHKGTSYVSLNPREPKQHFFVGHPALADDPEIVLACVQLDDENWALEVHNPTDTVRQVTVRPSPGLSFLLFEPRTVDVAPGASVHLAIASSRGVAP